MTIPPIRARSAINITQITVEVIKSMPLVIIKILPAALNWEAVVPIYARIMQIAARFLAAAP